MSHATFRERALRKLNRILKMSRRRLLAVAAGGRPQTRPVFVFGAQRSGTRVPLIVADRSPDMIAHGERTPGFYRGPDGVLLAEYATLKRSLDSSFFPIVMLKPICDSHRANEILGNFPDSRGLWIFRHYRDTVNSAAAKWPFATERMKRLADGDVEAAGWWAGGLTEDDFKLVRQHYDHNMTPEAAHALLWYLRSSFYFRLALNEREDVRLIKYEDLVREPRSFFSEVFQFLDVTFRASYVSGVYDSSVGAWPSLELPNGIRNLCSKLYGSLTADYRMQCQ